MKRSSLPCRKQPGATGNANCPWLRKRALGSAHQGLTSAMFKRGQRPPAHEALTSALLTRCRCPCA
eukprot:2773802-Alexandrium_andersonii.AAC.1